MEIKDFFYMNFYPMLHACGIHSLTLRRTDAKGSADMIDLT